MTDDYLYIDPNHRLGSDYDEGSENPREWNSVTGFEEIDGNRNHIKVKSEYAFPGNIDFAHRHFDDAGYPTWEPAKGHQRRKNYYPEAEEITARWARIFYGIEVVYDDEEGGYWFVDPDEFKLNWPVDENNTVAVWEQRKKYDGTPDSGIIEVGRRPKAEQEFEIIKGEMKLYHAWGEGNVFYVFGQKRVVRHVITTAADTDQPISDEFVDDWETEDSVSGIYSDTYDSWLTEEEVRAVADEHFPDEYSSKKK